MFGGDSVLALSYTMTDFSIDSTEERERFRQDPSTLVRHSKELERKLNRLFHALYHGSEAQKQAIKFLHETMKQKIQDPELLKCNTGKLSRVDCGSH
jgi:hypothetical protein